VPLYEYRCDECSHQFERLVRAQGTETTCPECGSKQVTKLISSGGFILKGDGWFKDGYSKGGGDGDG
jgi:putative FmdB family regulatory protein